MHDSQFSRTEILFGPDALEALKRTRVILFGVGGVGSWAAETLVRTGIGNLTIVDFDRVAPSNVNRQLPAICSTIGLSKVDVMRSRLLDINPEAQINAIDNLYSPDTADSFDLDAYDYVVDAIDSLRDKCLLINRATRSRARLFSSMGAALKTDPTKVSVSEFWQVKGCRLAAALRNRFKRSGELPSRKFKVVWSPEIRENCLQLDTTLSSTRANGSLMQVTAVFGCTLASLVINDVVRKVSPNN